MGSHQTTETSGIPAEETAGQPNSWQKRFDAFLERVLQGGVSQAEIDAQVALFKTAPKGSISGRGKFAGIGSSSEEFAVKKQEEIALEEERETRRR